MAAAIRVRYSVFRTLYQAARNRSTKLCSIHPFRQEGQHVRGILTSLILQAGIPATQILMPALSPTMEEGTIVKWHKKEGDSLSVGDALCDIETDKATITMDADDDGVLAKIVVPEGTSNIKISDLIALVVDQGEDYTKVDIPLGAKSSGTEVSSTKAEHTVESLSQSEPSRASAPLSPAVRLLLETHKLDSRLIPSTGPGGRLLKGDILRFINSGRTASTQPLITTPTPVSIPEIPSKTTPKQPDSQKPSVIEKPGTAGTLSMGPKSSSKSQFTDLPNSGMRQTIAKRLTESKTTIPHSYAITDCIMDNLLRFRSELQKGELKVSVNDFIIKAAALALRDVPGVNSVYSSEGPQELSSVDVSVAVATNNGLITPVVKDAVVLKVSQISSIVKDLSTRARQNKLKLNEFQGGSFTISNLGMFGITKFSAVINPPQAAILAVGATRMVVMEDESIAKVMTVTLSCDARVVDESLAVRWLEIFKKNIENPKVLGL